MGNLFWKTGQATKGLLATPFKTEEEFEKLVFETPVILEDVFLLKRQVRGGAKSGIPDIVGIDNDGNICIVEMKNVVVDAAIIPQVLQYAFWAEMNPDSIKTLWLEADNKPDDISVSWDDFEVRIIVIAPTIMKSTLEIVNKINYKVDLVEINRWVEGGNIFLLVNRLAPDASIRPRPVTGMEIHDEEFYMKRYNKTSVKEFLRYTGEVEKFIKHKGWNLETKYNKHYCGFKAGFFNAFGIKWVGSKTFALFFKLSEAEAKATKIPMTRYENQWKEAVYFIVPGKSSIPDYEPLFEKAHDKLV